MALGVMGPEGRLAMAKQRQASRAQIGCGIFPGLQGLQAQEQGKRSPRSAMARAPAVKYATGAYNGPIYERPSHAASLPTLGGHHSMPLPRQQRAEPPFGTFGGTAEPVRKPEKLDPLPSYRVEPPFAAGGAEAVPAAPVAFGASGTRQRASFVEPLPRRDDVESPPRDMPSAAPLRHRKGSLAANAFLNPLAPGAHAIPEAGEPFEAESLSAFKPRFRPPQMEHELNAAVPGKQRARPFF